MKSMIRNLDEGLINPQFVHLNVSIIFLFQ